MKHSVGSNEQYYIEGSQNWKNCFRWNICNTNYHIMVTIHVLTVSEDCVSWMTWFEVSMPWYLPCRWCCIAIWCDHVWSLFSLWLSVVVVTTRTGNLNWKPAATLICLVLPESLLCWWRWDEFGVWMERVPCDVCRLYGHSSDCLICLLLLLHRICRCDLAIGLEYARKRISGMN